MIPVSLPQAIDVLQRGDVLIYPTETVYGLGVDAGQENAVQRLFRVKGRDAEKAVSILVSSREQIASLCSHLEALALQLIERFLPGPLTLVLPAASHVSSVLTGGSGWIGIRMSSHPLAQALARGLGRPLTSTSANPSGLSGSVLLSQLEGYFGSENDVFLLSGDDLPESRGSTVVKVQEGRIKLLREGEIPFTEIEKIIPGEKPT